MFDFFITKIVTIGSCIDQNKKSPSFLSISQKMLILHANLEFIMAREKFPLKKGNFFPNGLRRWWFFVLIIARANGNNFRVKQSNISLTEFFFDPPCSFN